MSRGSQVRDFAPKRGLRGVLGTVVLLLVLVALGLHIGWVLFPAGHGAGTSTAPTGPAGRTPCGPVTPQLPTTGAVPVRTVP